MDAFLKLRPVQPEDEPFLRELRAQIDVERLGLQFWSPEALPLAGKIVDLQFKAHAAYYKHVKSNWDTKDCIIEFNGHVVGRFIVTQDSRVVHLADIAVHHAFRGLGVGQAVIESTKAECESSRRPMHLHVDPANSVIELYVRMGFRVVEEMPGCSLMEWVPSSLQGKTLYFDPTGA